MNNTHPIYESAVARMREDSQAFWLAVLKSGLKISFIWSLAVVIIAVVLFVGASAEQMSSSRATAGVLGGGLFGLIFGASIEAMSREMYLRSSGLIIRQTAFRRVRVFPKQWIQIRRGVARKGFQRIEICGHNDSKQTVAMWITLKDADRLESWLNSS